MLSGAATLVLGPDIVNRQRRPATMRTVVEFDGPGNNGSDVRDGIAYEIKTGDVVVIPAGTGHWFTKIEDHIDYLMVRIIRQSHAAEKRGAVAGLFVEAGKERRVSAGEATLR